MKTKLHHYRFDSEADPRYKAMVADVEANGVEGRGHWMNCIADPKATPHDKQSVFAVEDVDIDTSCIFENQWNETTESGNRRLFDWYEGIIYNNGRKSPVRFGHWLEITPEMTAARKDTRKCGYCGHHYGPFHDPIPTDGFCHACLDSPYLKEGELHLLRLLPLVGLQTREKLSDEETARLLPMYVDRQTTGTDSRAKAKRDKQRADVLAKYAKESAGAATERDGMLWLWDRGFSLDNVIFYSHTQRFGFGWRDAVSPSVESKLLDVISEFPFGYTIKCADGRTLENCVED